MTREEKIKIAIEKGYTCNPDTGEVFGIRGKKITKKNNGYIIICMRLGKLTIYIYAHQFIWYVMNNQVVDCLDHINGIKNDNRIENLRAITQHQNLFNKLGKGYCYRQNKKNKKYQSYIVLNTQFIHLGYFITEEEAKQAYLEAKKIYHIID